MAHEVRLGTAIDKGLSFRLFIMELFGLRPQLGPMSKRLTLATLLLVWLPLAVLGGFLVATIIGILWPNVGVSRGMIIWFVSIVVTAGVQVFKSHPSRLLRILAMPAVVASLLLVATA